jgi:hypothetical protein
MSVKLIVEGLELDMYDDEDLNISYSIEDILNLEVRRSDFSKDFKMPGTGKNNTFFNKVYDFNIDNQKNYLKAIPCELIIDAITIIRGSLRLLSARRLNNEVIYAVQITGRFRDLMTQVEQLSVRDIDLSEFNHTRNRTNIIDSWEYRIFDNGQPVQRIEPGRGYVYPYIVTGASNDIYDNVYVWDSYPAVYLKTIMDKIFEATGFTYESKFLESDYFKSLIIPWSRDYVQDTADLVAERTTIVGLNPQDQPRPDFTYWSPTQSALVIDNNDFVAITPLRSRSTSWWYSNAVSNRIRLTDTTSLVFEGGQDLQFTDLSGQWQLTQNSFGSGTGFRNGRWVAANTGLYNVRFYANVFPQYFNDTGATIIYNDSKEGFEYNYRLVHIKNNGTQVVLDQTDGTQFFNSGNAIIPDFGIDLNSAVPNMQPWRLSAQNVFIEVGERLEVRYGFRFPSLNFVGNNNNIKCRLVMKRDFGGEFTKLTVTPSENRTFGDEPVNMNQALPDNLSIKNLFLDVIKMFNLVIAPDKFIKNKLVIEPREDYWRSRTRIKSWKYDQNSSVVIKPMSEVNFNKYSFKYRSDNDYLNDRYKSETGKEWSSREFKIRNDYSSSEKSMSLSVFSPTPLTDAYTNDRVTALLVNKESNNLRPRNVNTRILFYGGLKPCEPWFVKSNINVNGAALTQYPYAGHFDDPRNPKYDLAFGPTEKIYHNINSLTPNDIFMKFHYSTFNQLVDPNNKILEAFFPLTAEEVADFDFRDIIEINGGYWRVNEIIDYNPNTKRLTKVQLYKINLIKTYDLQSLRIPVSNRSCPTNISVAIDSDNRQYYTSNNGEVNGDCCNALGGFFQSGVCYLDGPPNTGVPIGIGSGTIILNPILNTTLNPVVRPVVVTQPVSDFIDFNSVNVVGTQVTGKGNYISKDSGIVSVIGKDTSSIAGSNDSYAFGEGITIDRPKTFYINDVAVDSDGDIVNIKPYVISGGKNTTLPAFRTNVIEVVHGGVNAVRNSGGDQKKRVLIADIPPPEFGPVKIPLITNVNGTVEIYQFRTSTAPGIQPTTTVVQSVAELRLDADEFLKWNFDIPLFDSPAFQSLPIATDYYIQRVGNNWLILDPNDDFIATLSNSVSDTCPQGRYEFSVIDSGFLYVTRLDFYGCGASGPLGPNPSF